MSEKSEENKPQEQKSSYVSEEDAEKATQENAVNELLKMSPLSRLVLSSEQIAKEMNMIRLELEKLVKVFTDTKSVTNISQTPKIERPTAPEKTQAKPEEKKESTPTSALLSVPEQQTVSTDKIVKLKEKLGPELADMLEYDVSSSSNFIVVKPKKFLGTENFKIVCAKVKELGGDYIPAGKDSRWQLPKLT